VTIYDKLASELLKPLKICFQFSTLVVTEESGLNSERVSHIWLSNQQGKNHAENNSRANIDILFVLVLTSASTNVSTVHILRRAAILSFHFGTESQILMRCCNISAGNASRVSDILAI
jgi:hypothetical protein